MRTNFLTGLSLLALAGCGGGGEESRVYDESEADQAASALARGDEVTVRMEGGEELRMSTDDSGEPLPDDLPVYPGAERTGGFSSTSQGAGAGQVVAFLTDDSPEEVIAFYRRALERGGREITASMDMGPMRSISATDSDRRGGITVTATDAGTGTSITIGGGRSGG